MEPGQVQQGLWCRGQVRFNRVPEKVPEKAPEKVWEVLAQSQVKSNRVPEKVPEKVWEVWFNRVPEKVWEASVQSKVRFNKVPETVLETVWEALVQNQVRFWRRRLWCRARSGSTGFRRRFRRRSEGLGGFGGEAFMQSQVRLNGICSHFIHGNPAEVFQRLSSQHASERFAKIKRCGCWGHHRSLFSKMQANTATSGP